MLPVCISYRYMKKRKRRKARIIDAFYSLGEGRPRPGDDGEGGGGEGEGGEDDGMGSTSSATGGSQEESVLPKKRLPAILSLVDRELRPTQYLEVLRACNHRRRAARLEELRLPMPLSLDIALTDEEVTDVKYATI